MQHKDKDYSDMTPEQLQTYQMIKKAIEELAVIVHRQRQQRRRRKAKQARETE